MIIRDYRKNQDVSVFDGDICENHPDYCAEGLEGHIERQHDHFWFVARKEFLLSRFGKHIDKGSRGIDIGSGTGNVAAFLISNGYRNLCVGEMHRSGLEYARRLGIKALYQFDILKPAFEDEFDFVCLFDLLEHVDDENKVLRNACRMLHGNNGKIIITVPAHQCLWSLYDSVAHHKRRYTKNDLRKKLGENGFDVIEIKYFFMLITPLLFLRRLFMPDRGGNYAGCRAEDSVKNRLINKILLGLCRMENRLIDCLPNFFGGSLYAVARVAQRSEISP